MTSHDGYLPIGAYAVIGDCHTAALVSRHGSVDWYCPGRFDAPAIFCRILDDGKGGYFSIAPPEPADVSRRYVGMTNVLETTYGGDGWSARVTDALVVTTDDKAAPSRAAVSGRTLLRLVEGRAGQSELILRLHPTFNYGRDTGEITPLPDLGALLRSNEQTLILVARGVELHQDEDGVLSGRLRLGPGERRWIALVDVDDVDAARSALGSAPWEDLLEQTLCFWEKWADDCVYQGPYRREVLRSALVLKLLTYQPSGALVAAPTTSLPEEIGGQRNWDYRFTWLRDSALILYALITVGFGEEATAFFEWLDRVTKDEQGQAPQILYTIDGSSHAPERTLDRLDGYRHSRPVRIGNAAARQRQLDIFGEVLSAAYLHYHRGGNTRGHGQASSPNAPQRPSDATWSVLRSLAEQAADNWQKKGHGIWEVRGKPRLFLYGRLMCWAALDRGLRLAKEHDLDAPIDRWQQTEREIRHAILTHGYDEKVGAFTQAFGSKALDASALAIPRVGFLPATDPRVQSTIRQIQQHLTRDGLVYRYRTEDGLPGGEGTFVLCTLWLVDALALAGKLDEANALLDKVAGYTNDVGLLSEEIDASSGSDLGNFPQGFTHAAFITAAVNLAKASKYGAEHESETEGERAGRAHAAASEDTGSSHDRGTPHDRGSSHGRRATQHSSGS